jgi:hypothetical protein
MNQAQQMNETLGQTDEAVKYTIRVVNQSGVRAGDPKYHLAVETSDARVMMKGNADTVGQAQAWIKKAKQKYKDAKIIADGAEEVVKGMKEGSVYEVIMKQRDRDSIEELMDKNGLSELVETIAEIAFEKQEHIEQGDGGPTGLSRSWGKDGKALDSLSAKLSN